MVGGRGQSLKPVKVGLDGTPGDRFGPEKSGSQTAFLEESQGADPVSGRVGDDGTQSVVSQVVVGVNGQSGGTQRDPERERRWRPVKALVIGIRQDAAWIQKSRPFWRLKPSSFVREEDLGGGLMMCCPRTAVVRARAIARQQQ